MLTPSFRPRLQTHEGLAALVLLACVCLGFFDVAEAAAPKLLVQVARFKQGELAVTGSYVGKRLPADGQVKLFDRKWGTSLAAMSLRDRPAKRNIRKFRYSIVHPYDIPCAVRVSAEGAKDKFKKVTGAPKKNCSTGKIPPVAVIPTPVPSPTPFPTPTPTPTPTPSLEPLCEILEPVAGASLTANTPVTFRGRLRANDPVAPNLNYEWDFAGGAMERPKGSVTGEEQINAKPVFVRSNSTYRVRLAATDSDGRRCEAAVDVAVGTPPTGLPAKVTEQPVPATGGALAAATGSMVVLPFEDWTMQNMSDARTLPNFWIAFGPVVNNLNAIAYRKARLPESVGESQVSLLYSAASNPKDPAAAGSINSTSQNWPLGSPLLGAAIQKTDIFGTAPAHHDDTFQYSYATFAAAYPDPLTNSYPQLTNLLDEGYHNARLNPPLNADHGRYMPGIATPYSANDPQPFGAKRVGEDALTARMLPVTDIDDAGRVNPYPLFRIQARDTSGAVAAATDSVLTASRDFHCRECHTKGKLGANPNIARAFGDWTFHDGTRHTLTFHTADSDSLFDQEYAALKNTAELHPVYGSVPEHMNNGSGPRSCNNACHVSGLALQPYGQDLLLSTSTPLPTDMHRSHGLMRYNADHSDIKRSAEGKPLIASPEDWNPALGTIPDSLFPIKDADGKLLPMEQNCLKCHAGAREQCYRDRMYTAGVTCYQCHGDMLALAGKFPKSQLDPNGQAYREPWFDEPDCAACHTGNANRGKNGANGFFSAAVMRSAFDETDPSATPRRPDRFNPDASRFAVPNEHDLGVTRTLSDGMDGPRPVTTPVRLFRTGKDAHGQVACAACHGGAHAIWPNRDPNANDNVTATKLQGHTGPIAECGVCHAADAFAKLSDLDEGGKHPDPKTGVLGGPHNMHPVNNPTWWQQATTPSGAVVRGGWHVNYTRRPGRAGEDQCEACHGNDRQGARLSKASADRQFVDELGKPVSVTAGTPIGCQLCHSIAKSCQGSPTIETCGQASDRVAGPTNQAPVIRSQPALRGNIGSQYRYTVDAVDPEGTPLTVQLARPAEPGLKFDPATRTLSMDLTPASMVFSNLTFGYQDAPVFFSFAVLVKDAGGALSSQTATVKVDCPPGSTWSSDLTQCVAVAIKSKSPKAGLDAGQAYRYPIVARQGENLPLTYSLTGAPPGMAIGAGSGLIEWSAQSPTSQTFNFTATVKDNRAHEAKQAITLWVCAAPERWSGKSQRCESPITFTTASPVNGLTAGDPYRYPVSAEHRDKLALTFKLNNAPDGMSIDAKTGLVNWASQAVEGDSIYFEVIATDSQGFSSTLPVSLTVCSPPLHWAGEEHNSCVGPILFDPFPEIGGVAEGDLFQHTFTAKHSFGLPITFSLVEETKPADMSIDRATGKLSWRVGRAADSSISFSVIGTDSQGNTGQLDVSVNVCNRPMQWVTEQGGCVGEVHITSSAEALGLDGGARLSYQARASHDRGLPIQFRLANAPEGAQIDTTGLITWDSSGFAETQAQAIFDVIASDGLGSEASQGIGVNVCPAGKKYFQKLQSCYVP